MREAVLKYPDDFINKIICGDCLDVMKYIPDKSISMILTDPPYGINYCSNWTDRKEKIINDNFLNWENLFKTKQLLVEFKRILTDTGCCCCCCGGGGKTPVTAILTMEVVKHFELIQTLVWKKFIGLGWRYRPAYENILVFSKSKNNYNFYDTTKKCSNVIEGINQNIPLADDHPTQKPVELMGKLLEIHSKENDLILDPFCGGGSTIEACIKLKRNYIGIDIKQDYVEISDRKIKYYNQNPYML